MHIDRFLPLKGHLFLRPLKRVALAWVALVATQAFLFGFTEDWKSLYNQGVTAIESNDPSSAARFFEKAGALHPNDPNVLFGLASAYFKSGTPQQGVEIAQKLLSHRGLDFKTLMATGHLLMINGHIEKAIEAFQLAQKIAPPTVEGQKSSVYFDSLFAYLLRESKRNGEAIEHLQRLVEAEPNDPEVRSSLVLMLAWTGDFARSYVAAKQALQDFPKNPQVLLSYALASYFAQHADTAESAYRQLIEMEPDSDQPYFALGNFHSDLGWFRDAAQNFELAVSKGPENYLNRYMYGMMLLRLNKISEATAQFNRTLELNPSHADSYFWLGQILLREGKADEALAEFERTIKLEPKHIGAYYQLGLLYARKGEKEKSKEMFKIQDQLNTDIHKGIIHDYERMA
jgi:tetratricopeptide (TPR) repeat protein